MGGVGSGRWVRCNSKDTVESYRSIDIRYFNRKNILWPGCSGILRWYIGDRERGKIHFRVDMSEIILTYRYRILGGRWDDVEQHIDFDWTPCNFGGSRQWFLCPSKGCGKRVAVLYSAGKDFACRHCYDLVYQSQRESAYQRVLRRHGRAVKDLGREYW